MNPKNKNPEKPKDPPLSSAPEEKHEGKEGENFAIIEDFIEESPKTLSSQQQERVPEPQEKPKLKKMTETHLAQQLQAVQKAAREAKKASQEPTEPTLEENTLEENTKDTENTEALAQKTRAQLKALSEQAQIGLTAKIKKILRYQRAVTILRDPPQWQKLQRLTQDAQMGITAKIKAAFLPQKEEDEEQTLKPISCLFGILGIAGFAILIVLLIEKFLTR